jgi:branched-chain amino acid transport system permease protein
VTGENAEDAVSGAAGGQGPAYASAAPARTAVTDQPATANGGGQENAVAGRRPWILAELSRVLARQGSVTHLVMGLALVAAGLWAAGADPFVILVGQSCVIFAVASVGQSVLISSAGQIALSGAAFMAIGAFATGMMTGTPLAPFPIPLIVCAVIGWVVGLISGLPGLRFRGLYLLLASLALQFIVSAIATDYENDYHPAGLMVPVLHMGSLSLASGRPLYLALVVVFLIAYAFVAIVERTGVGLAWRAIRESEVAAAVSGVDVVRWKLYAFATSGAITAAAGCLYAYFVGLADASTYDLSLSIALITMIYIGGIRSRLGALIGAVIITAMPYLLQNYLSNWLADLDLSSSWYTTNQSEVNAGLFSLLFLLVVLFEPEGIEGLLLKAERAGRRLLPAVARRGGTGPAG